MLQGVSKFINDFGFSISYGMQSIFMYLCVWYLYHAIYSIFGISCQILFATCVFSIGAGVFEQNKTIFEVRKHSG